LRRAALPPGAGERAVDAAFAALERGAAPAAGGAALGRIERQVFALAEPGRTVERIVDLSRLGEFEACKALLTLVSVGVLEAVPPAGRSAAAGVSAYARSWRVALGSGARAMAVTAALAVPLAGLALAAAAR
jgi:hypothetical protein